jgi:enoyl-CoA hydratase/carnithine racemase
MALESPDAEVLADLDRGVLTLTLHRPDARNAFTVAMANQLLAAFDRADADPDVRVVVLTGSGRAFCVGADLGGGADSLDMAKSPDEVGDKERDLGGVVALRIFDCTKPVIAAINGSAAGIGITMTLPADVRLLADGAKVTFPFAARGIVPDAASSWFLPRIVGIDRALEWCLTADVLTAAEALEGGLVRRVLPPEEVLPAAQALATSIAERTGPVSATLTRHLLWRMLGTATPMEAHRLDSKVIAHTSQRPDAYEGITAFLEKRPARWASSVPGDLPEWFPWWPEERFRPTIDGVPGVGL